MLTSMTFRPQPLRSLWSRLEKPLTALFVTLGVAAIGLPQASALGVEVPNASHQAAIATAQSPTAQLLSDGIYLFGQSPQANQIGAAYMVFEVIQNRVIGAFYMPSSSFDCFYGELQANQLAVNVIDSYEQTEHPFSIAMESRGTVAGNGTAPVSFAGFHRIQNVSRNDQHILNVCKASRQP